MGLLVAETAFVHACFANWPLRSFSAASVALLAAQRLLAPRHGAQPAALSPAAVNTTFLVLGLGGVGLMARVWLDAAFA